MSARHTVQAFCVADGAVVTVATYDIAAVARRGYVAEVERMLATREWAWVEMLDADGNPVAYEAAPEAAS